MNCPTELWNKVSKAWLKEKRLIKSTEISNRYGINILHRSVREGLLIQRMHFFS